DGLFTINRSDINVPVMIEVHDIQGRLLGAPQPFTNGATSMQLDLSAYADGVYTIVIRSSAVETKRVVIAHQ
ncbi:MAG TPA: T9SS type A sorting domain-containing protein, partial [Bacteroidia bacterium]|nr:T9SS type A sorting domain-containing protein [Bacteroidia bacterium]